MTAVGLQVITLDFPDPDSTPLYQNTFKQVNATLSYTFEEKNKIRTLSATSSTAGNDIDGLLYVPIIDNPNCNISTTLVPRNVTKAGDLPGQSSISLIAIAPWISAECTLAYLAAVQRDAIRSFLFFVPNGGTAQPPVPNDPQWTLNDGGRWKRTNKFPVYAIPGATGAAIMQQLSQYSGNVTTAPNGHELANEYAPSDYIRLAAEVNLVGAANLPSLWVFLLIVLAILIFIIGSTSFTMHWLQRRRRERLRRRVAVGEVDLEALGIKRLTVPQEVLDKLPTYVYTSGRDEKQVEVGILETTGPSTYPPPRPHSSDTYTDTATTITTQTHKGQLYAQPTCAICLDDYTPCKTIVRELPCRHIFHPECIDSFLRENSSLCPLCKKTTLPKGYCPALITNAMVRRERMVRRIRERLPAEDAESSFEPMERRVMSVPRVRDALRSATAGGRRVFSAPTQSSSAYTSAGSGLGVEMRATPEDRTEWARQRALAMLGPRRVTIDPEVEATRRPRWRKVVGRIWPGLA
ncbi:hypothetical protein FKW77_008516 [Venturia effusa]|uniref:RING-type domain-containing protein n=1 Tax=Venturia effusa TaxID=50376 RepID=A0A517L5Y7_9PEZI|nr:hypothetical protein FKW77_008516 [Venturia effusa]